MASPLLSRWKLEMRVPQCRTSDSSFCPPGMVPSAAAAFAGSAQHAEDDSEAAERQNQLMRRRAMDVALGPLKSLPMNMFMMYMAGRSVSIFPIMMVAMMLWRPLKAVTSVGSVFVGFPALRGVSLFFHHFLYVLGHLGAIGLALYKIHSMGLLPNTASDWLDFESPSEPTSYVLHSTTFL